MLRKRSFLLVLVTMLVVAGVALPARSAQAGGSTVEITNIWDDGCAIHVDFYSNLPGTHRVELWDDGVLVAQSSVEVTTAGYYTTLVALQAPPAPMAPGVGIILWDAYSPRDIVDPYYLTGAYSCGVGPDMVAIPETAVGGAFIAPADVYYGPSMDKLADPPVTLAPGTTVWVIGVDSTGDFYKILFAGKFLWVKAETLGPNFDEVWNGTPLPGNTVE